MLAHTPLKATHGTNMGAPAHVVAWRKTAAVSARLDSIGVSTFP